MTQRALVVGSEGNIGTPLVQHLRRGGHEVLESDIRPAWRDGYVMADINHPVDLLPAFDWKPDVVFLLSAMVLLACSVSLRFFRFGGVAKMVLGGIAAGFLLYVLSKVTEDLSKAELLNPAAAAWSPVLAGGLTGFVVLLYQEDG